MARLKKCVKAVFSMDSRICIGIYGVYFFIWVLMGILNNNNSDGFVILSPIVIITIIRLLLKKDVIPYVYAILLSTILLLAIDSGL